MLRIPILCTYYKQEIGKVEPKDPCSCVKTCPFEPTLFLDTYSSPFRVIQSFKLSTSVTKVRRMQTGEFVLAVTRNPSLVYTIKCECL